MQKIDPYTAALQQLKQYSPNTGIQSSYQDILYDYTTYAAAGQAQLNFFQTPVGQSSKTNEDTNMTNAGMLPAPQAFFVTGIEVYFYPAPALAVFGAEAVAAALNDLQNFANHGFLQFTIGTKTIAQAPIMRFPPTCGLSVTAAAADASTVAGAQQTRIAYGSMSGRPYDLGAGVLIPSTQNFNVSLNWGTVQAVSAQARVGINLNGIRFTLAQ